MVCSYRRKKRFTAGLFVATVGLLSASCNGVAGGGDVLSSSGSAAELLKTRTYCMAEGTNEHVHLLAVAEHGTLRIWDFSGVNQGFKVSVYLWLEELGLWSRVFVLDGMDSRNEVPVQPGRYAVVVSYADTWTEGAPTPPPSHLEPPSVRRDLDSLAPAQVLTAESACDGDYELGLKWFPVAVSEVDARSYVPWTYEKNTPWVWRASEPYMLELRHRARGCLAAVGTALGSVVGSTVDWQWASLANSGHVSSGLKPRDMHVQLVLPSGANLLWFQRPPKNIDWVQLVPVRQLERYRTLQARNEMQLGNGVYAYGYQHSHTTRATLSIAPLSSQGYLPALLRSYPNVAIYGPGGIRVDFQPRQWSQVHGVEATLDPEMPEGPYTVVVEPDLFFSRVEMPPRSVSLSARFEAAGP
jgi:hypothetical protein